MLLPTHLLRRGTGAAVGQQAVRCAAPSPPSLPHPSHTGFHVFFFFFSFFRRYIADNAVVVFSWSGCPFCKRAKGVLDATGAKYTALELDQMAEGAALLWCSCCCMWVMCGHAALHPRLHLPLLPVLRWAGPSAHCLPRRGGMVGCRRRLRSTQICSRSGQQALLPIPCPCLPSWCGRSTPRAHRPTPCLQARRCALSWPR